MFKRGNIYTNLPDASEFEAIQTLAQMAGAHVQIERIVSEGQATPPGHWYDQPWDEWVLILKGGAELEFDSPPAEERLSHGDWLLIPAGRLHRVRSTEPGTLWLAVHGDTSANSTLTQKPLEQPRP